MVTESEIQIADLFLDYGTVLVVRREDQALVDEMAEVAGVHHTYAHRHGRHFGKRQVVAVGHRGDTAVLDAERLRFSAPENRRERGIFVEVYSVITEGKAQIGEGRQIVVPFVIDDARIGQVKVRVVFVKLHHFKSLLGIDWETDLPVLLAGTLGYTDDEPNLAVQSEYTRIEQTCNLHAFNGWFEIFGEQNRVLRISFCNIHC